LNFDKTPINLLSPSASSYSSSNLSNSYCISQIDPYIYENKSTPVRRQIDITTFSVALLGVISPKPTVVTDVYAK